MYCWILIWIVLDNTNWKEPWGPHEPQDPPKVKSVRLFANIVREVASRTLLGNEFHAFGHQTQGHQNYE